jgi:hypothetical protein
VHTQDLFEEPLELVDCEMFLGFLEAEQVEGPFMDVELLQLFPEAGKLCAGDSLRVDTLAEQADTEVVGQTDDVGD